MSNGVEYIWRVLFQFFKHSSYPETKHSGIPEVVTSSDIGLRGLQVRLLYKTRHLKATFEVIPLGSFNIAKPGFWVLWLNTEGYQPTLGSKIDRFINRNGKSLLILNQMVSCQNQHVRIWTVAFDELQSGSSDRSCSVTTERL
ncbi:hypothetical protein D3C81_1693480 [compost metagenome]